MRTYEKKLSTDTFLCGGLIAIGMAWLAFSAAQFAPGAQPHDRAAPFAVDAPVQVHPATASELAVLPPAAGRTGQPG